MTPILRRGTTARYSDFTVYGGVVYCVEVPPAGAADASAQTAAMLASLERLLVEAGSAKDRLLLATLYLTDMADYDAVNAVWDAWVPPGTAPARACVQVCRLADPAWKVEVAVQAARN
ncbi:MAG TPA: RidA family protein [Rhodocyclaceae bacterium]|nr:RidA family protein [Rhodocyclaceae bacterium]HMZ77410.1 RidA family protein [Rhodocyclaceae bacterium]HNC79486.1 RidA family protein [Rhodocyclaceae bacterium]HNE17531.1 RidA family protein [Rhodocyclaceae bacterium]